MADDRSRSSEYNRADDEKTLPLDSMVEIERLFKDLKMRDELAQIQYRFDQELPSTVLESFNARPWIYTDVGGLWVVRDSGIPVLAISYRQDQLDQFLLAGFFGAVNNFADTLGTSLQQIVLEGSRFLFLWESDYGLIFSIAISTTTPLAYGVSLLSDIRDAFISRYHYYFVDITDIVITDEFSDFANHLTGILLQREFAVFAKTGVLRSRNPLLFQLARNIMLCNDRDLLVLRILDQKPDHVLSLQKVANDLQLTESKVRTSFNRLEKLELIRSLRDGRSKKYTTNLRAFLLNTAADSNVHRMMELALDELQKLIQRCLTRIESL